VTSVDGNPIGSGEAGPISRGLREHFERITAGRDPAFSHWLTLVQPAGA
jgi:hypothetical protein